MIAAPALPHRQSPERAGLAPSLLVLAALAAVTGGWGLGYLMMEPGASDAWPLEMLLAEAILLAALLMTRVGTRAAMASEGSAPASGGAAAAIDPAAEELAEALRLGRIVPHYQPIVHLRTGHLTGFECLARWQHPARGLLLPEDFLPLAERSGLVGRVTEALLARICADVKAWPAHLTLAINLSPVQMRDERLTRTILRALASGRLAPSRLIVEVAEAALLADPGGARVIVAALRRAGVACAINNFGTEPSAVRRLRALPFDRIKLAPAIVGQFDQPGKAAPAVRVLVMAHMLGLPITAVGVRSAATAELLARHGCDSVQGYLFGAPMTAHRAGNLADVLARSRHPDVMRLAAMA